jgi:hypothetical protein
MFFGVAADFRDDAVNEKQNQDYYCLFGRGCITPPSPTTSSRVARALQGKVMNRVESKRNQSMEANEGK